MRRGSFRTSAQAAGLAVVIAGVTACAQVLGLDDDLGPLDDGGTKIVDASIVDGKASDATADGHGDGGAARGDAGEAGLADAAGDRGGDGGPGAGSWQIDTTFNHGLAFVELTDVGLSSGAPPGIALLHHPTRGVLVVVMSPDDALLVYEVSQFPQSPGPTQRIMNVEDDLFAGAAVSPSGSVFVVTEQSGTELTFYDLDLADAGTPLPLPQQEYVKIANLVSVAGDGVTAVGSSGPGMSMTAAAQLTIGHEGLTVDSLSWAKLRPVTLLKTELTVDSGTYYGGLDDEGQPAIFPVWAVTSGGASVTGTLGATVDDGSGFTDLVAIDDQVYAVGFSDANFIFSPIPPPTDGGAPLAKLPVPDGVPYYSENGDPSAEAELTGQVDAQKRVLVGGFFGGVNLGNFLRDGGSDPQAFADPLHAGVHSAAIDLGPYLTSALGSVDWAFYSMLIDGPYLYVAAVDVDGDRHSVLVRLVQGVAP